MTDPDKLPKPTGYVATCRHGVTVGAIDLEQFRHAVEFWRRNCEMPHLETEASRLLALIDGQAGPDTIGDALSAMGNAYPLTDAGMQAALDGDQPTKGEGV